MPLSPTSESIASPSERDPDRLPVEELCQGAVKNFEDGVVLIDRYPSSYTLYAVNPDDMVMFDNPTQDVTDNIKWHLRIKNCFKP